LFKNQFGSHKQRVERKIYATVEGKNNSAINLFSNHSPLSISSLFTSNPKLPKFLLPIKIKIKTNLFLISKKRNFIKSKKKKKG